MPSRQVVPARRRPSALIRRTTAVAVVATLLVGLVPVEHVAAAEPRAADPTGDSVANDPRTAPPVTDGVRQTDRVVVRWDEPAEPSASARRASVAAATGRPVTTIGRTPTGGEIVDLGQPLGDDAEAILAELRSTPGVRSVEADVWVTIDALPDDPLAEDLWGLGPDSISVFGIDAPAAWSETRGAGVVVAVVDTGSLVHPDLAGQWLPGYDMISDATIANDGGGRDADATDPGDWCPASGAPSSWHGAHVAGTIGAIADNAIGVYGGAPEVDLLPVRALGRCGGYLSDLADAIRWAGGGTVPGAPANPNPADVINVSASGFAQPCPEDMAAAIADARSRGAVVVASAGNNAVDAWYVSPANCGDAVTVAAITNAGVRWILSNHGPLVDLAAPGMGIWSTVDTGATTPSSPGYAAYQGTSMAAPHVAAAAALLRARDPGLPPWALEAILRATARSFVGDPGGEFPCLVVGCGAGTVHVGTAMARLADADTPLVADVASATAWPAPGASITVTAVAIDLEGIGLTQVRVATGPWYTMQATDGALGGHAEMVRRIVPVPTSEGAKSVCVRSTDGLGHRSTPVCTTVTVDAAPPTIGNTSVSAATVAQGVPIEMGATATDTNVVRAAEVGLLGGPWADAVPTDGAFDSASEPFTRSLGGAVQTVSAGAHSCAVQAADDTVWCWGVNSFGEVGDGTDTHRVDPVRVEGLTGVTAIGMGLNHTCAIRVDTTLWCWGYNGYGQLGDGTWTDRHEPVQVPGLTGVVSVVGGFNHTCVALSSGEVRCMGLNNAGQLGDGTTELRNQPVPVVGLTGASQVMAHTFATCAVRTAGDVRCWGNNGGGELGDGTFEPSLTPVAVVGISTATQIGENLPCVLLANSSVRCWGSNIYGQLGDGTTTTSPVPVTVVGLRGVRTITSGDSHACALKSVGTVWCWGSNQEGQLALPHGGSSPLPGQVPGISGAIDLSSYNKTTCALLGDRSVRCWGFAWGDAGVIDVETPTAVPGLGPLPAGARQVCARAMDGAGQWSTGTTCRTITVVDQTVPTAAAFATDSPGPTAVSTLTFRLTFNEPVTGLAISDFLVQGSATGWSVTAVSGSGAGPYLVTLKGAAGRTPGTVRPVLRVKAVRDAAGLNGPLVQQPAVPVTSNVPA